jgi:hypothetical protein
LTRIENGVTFLFVRGDCRYWIFGVGTRDANQETREGVLDPSQEAALHDELAFDEWPQMTGVYGAQPSSHVLPDVLSDGRHFIRCFALCGLSGPEDKRALFAAMESSWLPVLYRQGVGLDGSMRMMVVDVSMSFPKWNYERVNWALKTAMASVKIPAEGPVPDRGEGYRIDAGEDVAILRDLRRNQLEELYHPASLGGFIPVVEDLGPLHALYARDVLPIEDERGIVNYEAHR